MNPGLHIAAALALGVLVLVPITHPRGAASAPRPLESQSGSDERLAYMRQTASQYTLRPAQRDREPLSLRAEPVLRWSNPVRSTEDGALFLWTDRGRPKAVLSFYTYQSKIDHEFQSLSLEPLTAEWRGEPVWTPSGAGVQFAPISGAPEVAPAAPTRLRQMRTLARDFRAFFDLPMNREELRLLPQPLYRYESATAEVIDGCLFAFAQATDPEVLLIIEARGGAVQPEWHYAFARMSMVNLRAQHKDAPVWKVDWWRQRDPNGSYLTIVRDYGK